VRAKRRNNENLARLSRKIISPVIFAHVRAAYPGMPVSEQNCHPFQWGRYLWMHNGVVGGFTQVRAARRGTRHEGPAGQGGQRLGLGLSRPGPRQHAQHQRRQQPAAAAAAAPAAAATWAPPATVPR
jgi:hypothetical protein